MNSCDGMLALSGFRKNNIIRILADVVEKNKLVLDIGCGDGAILRALDVKGVGIDIHPGIFPSGDAKNSYIRHSAAEELPLKSNTFDYCILSHIIEHLNPFDIKQTLTECFRVLKKGGKIIILTPEPSSHALITLLSRLRCVGKFDHKIYFTLDGLESLSNTVGFATKEKRHYNCWLANIYVGEAIKNNAR